MARLQFLTDTYKNFNSWFSLGLVRITTKFDIILALIGFIIGVILFLLGITFIRSILIFGIILIASCLIYLLKRNKWIKNNAEIFEEQTKESIKIYLFINILFIFLFIINLLILKFSLYSRPIEYLVIIAVMGILIVIEIDHIKNETKYILSSILKIIILGINIRASIYYEFPGFAEIDSGYHDWFTGLLLNSGNIPKFQAYSDFPVLHLITATLSLLSQIDIKNSLFISAGGFEVLSLIFVFLICNHYIDYRTSLLATLLLSINVYHVYWGYTITPMTLGVGFLPMLFYLIILKQKKGKQLISRIMIFYILLAIILTHTIVTTMVLTVLFFIFLSYLIYKLVFFDKENPQYISFSIIFTFLVSTLSYWIYTSRFFGSVVEYIKSRFTMDIYIVKTTSSLSFESSMIDQFGTFLMYLFPIIGSIYIFNIKNKKLFIPVLTALFLSTFIFIAQLAKINTILPGRWFPFVMVLLALPAGIGFRLLNYNKIVKIRRIYTFLLIAILFVGLFTNMLTNPDGAMQQINERNYRRGLTQSELQSVEAVSKLYDGKIGIDAMLERAFNNNGSQPYIITEYYINKNIKYFPTRMIILREAILNNAFFHTGTYRATVKLDYDLLMVFDDLKYNKMYDIGTTFGYFKEVL